MKGQYRDLVSERVDGFVRSENNKEMEKTASPAAEPRVIMEDANGPEEKPAINDVFPTESEESALSDTTFEKTKEQFEAIQSSDLDIHVRERRDRRVVFYLTPSNFYSFHKEAESLGVSMNELANLIYEKRYKK